MPNKTEFFSFPWAVFEIIDNFADTKTYRTMNTTRTISPFAHPLYVMLKPAGAACNLHCDYCYYLEKNGLYNHGERQNMDDQTLELFTKTYIEAQIQQDILFTWHGGEPLLRPIAFYQKALQLQQKYAGSHHIDNCIQTNGTLLNEEWCQFFHDNGFLVGVSIDGTMPMHDLYRKDNNGKGTFERVMEGIRLLNQYDVMWNAMAVVNSYNAEHPVEFYRFFKSIGCHYLQFTPIVERTVNGRLANIHDNPADCTLTSLSVTPEAWGNFTCAVFDEWRKHDIGEYFVQLFDATLANWCGVEPGVCSLSRFCGNALAMERNGDIYSCDHFVFPDYKLGNIHETPLAGMGFSERQNAFRRMKTTLPQQCRSCSWRFACNGECPKNRFAKTADGEAGLNYLCRGYRQFFSHVAPYMEQMKQAIAAGGSAADIMNP